MTTLSAIVWRWVTARRVLLIKMSVRRNQLPYRVLRWRELMRAITHLILPRPQRRILPRKHWRSPRQEFPKFTTAWPPRKSVWTITELPTTVWLSATAPRILPIKMSVPRNRLPYRALRWRGLMRAITHLILPRPQQRILPRKPCWLAQPAATKFTMA